jgi:hypothetical protein
MLCAKPRRCDTHICRDVLVVNRSEAGQVVCHCSANEVVALFDTTARAARDGRVEPVLTETMQEVIL